MRQEAGEKGAAAVDWQPTIPTTGSLLAARDFVAAFIRAAALVWVMLLAACDPIALDKLKVGESTEADVRDAMGTPEMVWDEGAGRRTFEYNRQPAGHVNYMITLGPDGRLQAIRQVLVPEEFARVKPGMHYDEVRRMLGKPAKDVWYPLSQEHHVNWRFLQDPTTSAMFTVVLDAQRVVRRASTGPDLDEQNRSGGRR